MLTLGAAARTTTSIAARGSSAAVQVIPRSTTSPPSDQTFNANRLNNTNVGLQSSSVGNPLSKFNMRQQTNSLFLLGVKRLCSATQSNNKQLPVGMLLTAPHRRGFANLSATTSSLREPLPGFDHPVGSFVDQFKKPEPKITTLENGIRLVTQENYGLTTTVGVWIDVGSRDETEEEYGLTHILERMSFKSTSKRTTSEMLAIHDFLGCGFTATTSREVMAYYVDGLRNHLPEIVEALGATITDSLYKAEEVLDLKEVVQLEIQQMRSMADGIISEIVHEVAFGENSPLGHSLLCSPEKLDYFVEHNSLKKFVNKHFLGSRMVVSAVGVDHDEFVRIAKPVFEQVPKSKEPRVRPPSPYVGGTALVDLPEETLGDNDVCNLIIAFKAPGVNDPDFIATCLLNMLLGGGSSFSSGGPGKGMYSRLYTRVLNRYHWVQHASSFVIPFEECSLFGIHCKSDKGSQRSMLETSLQELVALLESEPKSRWTRSGGKNGIESEELTRAKNRLKGSVCQGLEVRQQLFEDLGRQLLTYGEYQSVEKLCGMIDALTVDDLKRVTRRILFESPPTFATYSPREDNDQTPGAEAISNYLQEIAKASNKTS